MKRLLTTIILFLQLLFGCSQEEVGVNATTEKINGISFVASKDSINSSNVNPVLNVNSNYITLMPFAFIRDLNIPEVYFSSDRQWYGETLIGIEQYAKHFPRDDIKIMIKPQLWVWGGTYTGLIEMHTEEDWKILEDSYRVYILAFANLAQKLDAEIFCIGTELEKFVLNRPEYWNDLISNIKEVYKGKLTYAANWDEYKRITFWRDLDFIGIDAYFPLSDVKTPSVNELEMGWKPHKEEIKNVQSTFQKPILFTEFGYRSVDYTGKEPWNSSHKNDGVNLEGQENALQALHNQFWKEDWFAGGFLWKWHTDHQNAGGENNHRFTPQNKPAETLLKQLYGK
ncbi:glycoside hydrolase [Aureibaculum sp. 2210JD6-5]|uniref:glycoside hydrolase family 113 n=1 Tax=Aureibaculum sp. 2210JD6-5 TaxID=3103957 RepID=UPI002AAD3D46|nr:glycoside hydrolase [Aureibaculum sp. 2210JD6-5]MDY7395123.1 glycoside hydrolase [Aureibaculum sp. 2210JD6-5]